MALFHNIPVEEVLEKDRMRVAGTLYAVTAVKCHQERPLVKIRLWPVDVTIEQVPLTIEFVNETVVKVYRQPS